MNVRSSWSTTITLYDQKGRPIYTHSKNDFLGTEDITNIELDFVGNTLQTHSKHVSGNNTTTIVDNFTYDHAQRLIKQTQKINDQAEVLIVSNEYDELGQLKEKKVGGNDTQAVHDQTTALQDIAYDHNIRGWLTGINDVSSSSQNKLFAFGIRYNEPESTNTTPLYNGNISETHWRTDNTSTAKRAYAYQYDALNRLTYANFFNEMGNSDEDFSAEFSYDKNGNIHSLSRIGLTTDNTNGTIDRLDYDYFDDSNQLNWVNDNAGDNGFSDGNESGNDYQYDANGNMTADKNKNIDNIEYNHLNLPKKIQFGTLFDTGNTIEYFYDANGVKLKKVVTMENGVGIKETQYSGAFIYESTSGLSLGLKFISQPEGYIEPDNQGNFDYIFQYKDHLGNIRLSYKESKDLESHFTNSKDGWQNAGNVTSTLENGRLKVNVDSAWEGIKQNFNGGLNTSPGEEFLINLEIDKGNTQSNIRVLVQELDSNNNHISWNTLSPDLQTGNHSLNYTVNTGDKIKLKIDKVNTHTNDLTYFYVDHVIVSSNELEIIEENNYYPFGLKHKGYNSVINGQHYPYGYNGKEENDELGLEWLDYGFRNYDASLGRWFGVDPLAEKYYSTSPYGFVDNSPLLNLEIDGRLWVPKVNEDGSTSYIAEDGDSADTLAEQYDLDQEDAEAITGTEGDSEIEKGTEISGEKVKSINPYGLEGNKLSESGDVLKLDLSSELATDQRVFDQYMFGAENSRTEGDFGFYTTEYYGNVHEQALRQREGFANLNIGNETIRVNFQIPLYETQGVLFNVTQHSYFLTNNSYTSNIKYGNMFGDYEDISHNYLQSYLTFGKGRNNLKRQGDYRISTPNQKVNLLNKKL